MLTTTDAQIASLCRDFLQRTAELSPRLAEASAHLTGDGQLPDVNLLAQLQQMVDEFTKLKDALIGSHPECANAFSESPPLVALSRIAEGAEARNRETHQVLQDVLRLRYIERVPFKPLDDLQEKARALITGDNVSSDVTGLAALVRFVSGYGDLDDVAWQLLYKTVAAAVGAMLATAAGRGRLRLAETVDPDPGLASGASLEPSSTDAPAAASDGSAAHFPAATPQKIVDATPVDDVGEKPSSETQEVNTATSAAGDDVPRPLLTVDREAADSVNASGQLWLWVARDQIGLAYNLAEAMESEEEPAPAPSWLLRAAGLARGISQASGERAILLQQDLILSKQGDLAGNLAWQLMLVAAVLRPSLVASATTRAHDVLVTGLGDGLGELYALCREVQAFAAQHQGIDPASFGAIKDQDQWQTELQEAVDAARDLLQRGPSITMSYQAATGVWRKWLEPGGLIGEILRVVAADDRSRIEAVKRLTEDISDRGRIEDLVRTTDKSLRGGKKKEIVAGALARLLHEAEATYDIGLAWTTMQEERRSVEQPGPLLNQIATLRKAVLDRMPKVDAELDVASGPDRPMDVRAACHWLRGALKDVQALLVDGVGQGAEIAPSKALNADLLLADAVDLDEEFNVVGPEPAARAEAIKDLSLAGTSDWTDACRRRIKKQDFAAATLLVREISRRLGDAAADPLRRESQEALKFAVADLRESIRVTRREIERAVAHGLLREADRLDLIYVVDSMVERVEEIQRFAEPCGQLERVAAEVHSRRAHAVQEARARLAAMDQSPESEAYQLVVRSLDAGDVLSANEYMDTLFRPGAELPTASAYTGDHFEDFFPQRLREIEKFLKDTPIAQVISKVRRREQVPGVDMKGISDDQASRALAVLNSWMSVKKQLAITPQTAEAILTELGFGAAKVKVRPSPANVKQKVLDVTCEPIQDRERCPVPAFGSSVAGKYTVFCSWSPPNEEDMLHQASHAGRGGPVIVFLFGRFSERQRRSFAALCRQHMKSILVVDDALILYLCGVSGSHLPVMFECTLPFAYSEPFVTTASNLPAEMFYGRERERDSLSDPMGTCFVYGGRQLGKTALLREVARRAHRPAEGQIALWIDILGKGVGQERPIEDIWRVISEELQAVGPNGPLGKVSGHLKKERILSLIEMWLDTDPGRHILLLLDEADRFLESDGQGRDAEKDGRPASEFAVVRTLKELMDRTNRRFKVVFAGLHNVQRTTRQANNPLAHFGHPICVGPLLDDGEWRSARYLVEVPLSAIGYRFESSELVTRILSLTNYYPSLIQLYCSLLLRHLTSRNFLGFNPDTAPPNVITEAHIEAVYADPDLRQRIRERFMLTLRLDPRYELLAYIIAYESLAAANPSGSAGVTKNKLRTEALYWWREAFANDTSEEGFLALLEEMVGLGVLRVTPQGTYTLRSPNVALLMGTLQEIEERLQAGRELPVEYEPESFRSVLDAAKIHDVSNRNPLTARQVYELHRQETAVALVFGCDAGGIGRVSDHLRHDAEFGAFVPLSGILERAKFMRELQGAIKARARDVKTVICVDPSCEWTEPWLADALAEVRKVESSDSPTKVVFIADASTSWRLLANSPQLPPGVRSFSVRPWSDMALRIWLQSSDLGPQSPEVRTKILDVAGGWPSFLAVFHDACYGNPGAVVRELDALSARIEEGELADWATELGIDRPELVGVFSALAQVGEASEDDLALLVADRGIPKDFVARALAWGELLRLVARGSNETWRLDAATGRIIVSAARDR